MWKNQLLYGDNLDMLSKMDDASVDLVYLDPPFNSNRSYNVLYRHKDGQESQAQIEAFDDTWTWSQQSEELYQFLVSGGSPVRVADAVEAMRRLLGQNDVVAYLVMMAARLIELRRTLRPTGSLYLHCDPTASHYLKILLDALFGAANFKNEISWLRSGAKNDPRRYGRSHDVVLFYSAGKTYTWNTQYTPFEQKSIEKNYTHVEPETGRRYRRGDLTAAKPGGDVDFEWHGVRPYKGRHWAYSRDRLDRMLEEGRIEFRSTGMPVYKRYLDEQPGVPLQDVWTDIRLTSADKERLGYPTQKPLSLLERVIVASSDPHDVVLDPFCGCGTAIDAAQRLGRRWIGIDVTYLAIDLIEKRLRAVYGESIVDTFSVMGIPRDVEAARALFERSPFEFERWAVSRVDGQPNERQVGDRGVDGVIRFPADGKGHVEKVLVSVKGGRRLGPQMVRDLLGAISTQRAAGGLLITLERPTPGMVEAANHSGIFHANRQGRSYPKVQLICVQDIFDGKRPKLPPVLLPYIQAQPRRAAVDQLTLDA
ncbi:DNA methyltransferase [Actinomadura sp. 3N508]|uniref:DNA methyltransferase n=1 Tax=Actinomadura sp. 3N508 TaxID=3375153 RepID=UPI00379846EE